MQAMEENVAVDNKVEEVTLGHGIIDLVDKELQSLLETKGPYLKTQVYNLRNATTEAVGKLWTKMGRGENVQAISVEHEVIVAVDGEDFVAEDWCKKWDDGVAWSDKGKAGFIILMNGNHRLQLVKLYLLGKGLLELEECLKKRHTEKAEQVKKELRMLVRWTARVVDTGEGT
jgi:hypothetical protein